MIRYCVWDVGKTIYDYSLEPLERWIAARTADPEKFRSGGGLRAYDFDPYMLGKLIRGKCAGRYANVSACLIPEKPRRRSTGNCTAGSVAILPKPAG